MTLKVDLNADMGESYGRWTLGNDEALMPHLTSANVACGFHGGDPHVMRKTVALALEHGGSSDGAPGPRQGAMTVYYGAFIKDADGNKIEAVTFGKP